MKTISLVAMLAAIMALPEGTIMTNKEITRILYEEAINKGRLELIDQFVAPDYEGDAGSGPSGFRTNVERLRAGFPDIRFTIEQVIAEDDRVAVRWRFEATHDGPFAGVPPTHKRVTNSGIVIYQFRDGRIVRSWLEADRMGVLQQLGVIPQSLGQPKK